MASERDTGLEENIGEEESVFFDPDLPEDELVKAVKVAVDESERWWNSKDGFNLKEVRKKNKNAWLPNHLDELELYEHEESNAYIDPRIFVSTETIVATIAGQLPLPEVFPASDNQTSKRLANDLSDGLHAWAEEYQLLDIFRQSVRTNFINRLAVVKLIFDPNMGKDGDIVPLVCDPEDIIVDRHAKRGENPRFIAHRQTKTVDEWVTMFPQSKEKIYKALGIKRGVITQRAKRETVYETWFTHHDESGKPKESVAWVLKDTVIAKMRHPHWVHDDEKMDDDESNILKYPFKPFFPLNNLNLGKHWIDDTTLIEQAQTLQDMLEKRGRQLAQNADDGAGGLVINSQMIDSADAAKLTGDPNEKILVDGDVRAAATRIAPASLPAYVVEDKYDARQEIDNIFATHAPLRGQDTNSKTLGQDVLQSQQDMTRHDDLVRSLEFMASKLYKYVVQMMKVHYTEEHMFRMSGDNGMFNFVMLKNDKIEDGIDVKVKSGSTLPLDRATIRKQAMELSAAGLIDPLTLFETLQFPEPQKMTERLIKYTQDPAAYMKDFEEEDYERDAFANIQIINNGMEAQPVKEPTAQYLNYYGEYMMSGEFQTLPDQAKQAHIQHVQQVTAQLQQLMQLRETQLPTEEEIEAQNQKEAEMAAMQQQAMAGQAPLPQEEALMGRTAPQEQNVI